MLQTGFYPLQIDIRQKLLRMVAVAYINAV